MRFEKRFEIVLEIESRRNRESDNGLTRKSLTIGVNRIPSKPRNRTNYTTIESTKTSESNLRKVCESNHKTNERITKESNPQGVKNRIQKDL